MPPPNLDAVIRSLDPAKRSGARALARMAPRVQAERDKRIRAFKSAKRRWLAHPDEPGSLETVRDLADACDVFDAAILAYAGRPTSDVVRAASIKNAQRWYGRNFPFFVEVLRRVKNEGAERDWLSRALRQRLATAPVLKSSRREGELAWPRRMTARAMVKTIADCNSRVGRALSLDGPYRAACELLSECSGASVSTIQNWKRHARRSRASTRFF